MEEPSARSNVATALLMNRPRSSGFGLDRVFKNDFAPPPRKHKLARNYWLLWDIFLLNRNLYTSAFSRPALVFFVQIIFFILVHHHDCSSFTCLFCFICNSNCKFLLSPLSSVTVSRSLLSLNLKKIVWPGCMAWFWNCMQNSCDILSVSNGMSGCALKSYHTTIRN